PRGGGSSWQSLTRGTGTIEADYLNGEIALLGRLHGVPTPLNELLQHLANTFARERREAGSMPVGELVRLTDETLAGTR
ncbi:MAG: ketopantoate reductase family protein, partial [Streptomyces sp.]|nr:ketopantoate reductase family protein [Streptomyces sp.]